MLGEDTVVYTRNGFRKIKDLVLFDEVLTPFGDFEPIVEMGPWTEMTKKVELNTVEDIYCTDNLLWNLVTGSKYTDELDRDTSVAGVRIALEQDSDRYLGYSPYNYAVVVPQDVPNEIMMGSLDVKLKFLAGLIDSVMCELGKVDGVYNLYIGQNYKELADKLLAFIRSLGLGVVRKIVGFNYCITFNITKYIDILPIRDDMMACYDYASINRNVIIRNIEDLSKNDKIMGRMIKVNRGFFLVGYSLVPVC